MDRLKHNDGFTFVEVLIALAITIVVFGTMISVFLTVKTLNSTSRHHVQAAEIVRGQIETLKGTAYTNINDSTAVVPFDAGKDGVFGNADDMTGTLTTTTADLSDMDGDGNTTETSIDVDGDNINDAAVAIPVRVAFTWTQWVVVSSKTYTVSADTLIAA